MIRVFYRPHSDASFLTSLVLTIHADSRLASQNRSNLNHIIINPQSNSLLLWNIINLGTFGAAWANSTPPTHMRRDLPPNPAFLLLLDIQFSRSDFLHDFILDHSMAGGTGDDVICTFLLSEIRDSDGSEYKITVVLEVTPCNMVCGYRGFGRTYSLYIQTRRKYP